ncbi:MAG: YqeG family HAD IIIA-type phosphatase, partial [Coriobacteriia bacterium]|nr:YqeG family HAD IIIA-type phosphatase [Coriobacteriia bacterium]
KANIRAVLIDRDNTIVSREGHILEDDVLPWIRELKQEGIKAMIVSNSFKPYVAHDAEKLEIDYLIKALKPLPFGLIRAMRKLEVTASQTLMVGDQIFTDIVAANLVGMRSVLVEPLTQKDLWHTVQLRKLDKIILRGIPLEEKLTEL